MVLTDRRGARSSAPFLAPYWQLARRSFQRYSTYRGATFAGVFTNTVFGFLRVYVLLALYRYRSQLGGFGPEGIVTYAFVAQGLLATTGGFGNSEIADRIRTGDIVSDLYRPVHFQSYWMAQDLGRAAFQAVFRGIPPVAFGALVFTIRLPADPATVAEFTASVVLASVVAFAYSFTVSLAAFWLIDTRGLAQISVLVLHFFAGFVVPITFFPPALYHLARALPFASVVQYPIEIFLGRHPGPGALGVLGEQALWAVALVALNELIASRAMRKVVVQGG